MTLEAILKEIEELKEEAAIRAAIPVEDEDFDLI